MVRYSRLLDRLTVGDVRANHGWLRDIDVPDVLDWRDFHRQPEAALGALGARIERWGTPIHTINYMSYPKGSVGERQFPVLDPLAELAYRSSVKPVARRLAHSLPPQAMSRRVMHDEHGSWCAEPWRPRRAEWKAWMGQQQGRDPFGGRGFADVRSCFPSVRTGRLCRRVLPSLACDDAEIAPLEEWFQLVGRMPGHHSGLLIGQEASSVLGTAYLVPVDRRLGEARMVRWVDDVVIATHSREEFLDLVGPLDDQLQLGGQALNAAKTRWEPWSVDMNLDESLVAHPDTDAAAPGPLSLLQQAAETGEIDGVRAALASLTEAGDATGVDVLADSDWLAERLPRESAVYISQVWSGIGGPAKEWVTRRAGDAAPTADSAPLQMHLLHRCRRKREVVGEPDALLAAAESLLGQQHLRPLTAELLAAAGRHGRKRSWSRAVDIAFDTADLNLQRGALGEIPAANANRPLRRHVAELAKRSPGLLPVASAFAAT